MYALAPIALFTYNRPEHTRRTIEALAKNELTAEHRAQLLNYMRITKTKVGYLLNFGDMHELKWERFVI